MTEFLLSDTLRSASLNVRALPHKLGAVLETAHTHNVHILCLQKPVFPLTVLLVSAILPKRQDGIPFSELKFLMMPPSLMLVL